MHKQLRLYLNLALIGFTLGRAYTAFRRRMGEDNRARRRVWM
jgi:hypothetical protein